MSDGLELAGLLILGFAIGTYGTIIGLGGGFILVPVLLLLYPDYEPESVTAISLAVVCASTISGSIAYARQRRIDYVTGLIFAAASAPGVYRRRPPGKPPSRTRLSRSHWPILLLGMAGLALRGPPRGVRPPLGAEA